MKIGKSSGFGEAFDKIIEIAEKQKAEKTAAPAAPYVEDPAASQQLQQAINPLQKKPGLQTGAPNMVAPQQPGAAAVAPQQGAGGSPAQGDDLALQPAAGPSTQGGGMQAKSPQWDAAMGKYYKFIQDYSQWAKTLANQAMVKRNPELTKSLTQLATTIDQLPQSPQSLQALTEQAQAARQQLENFRVTYQNAYQNGHKYLSDSAQRLDAFNQFLANKLGPELGQANQQPQAQQPGKWQRFKNWMGNAIQNAESDGKEVRTAQMDQDIPMEQVMAEAVKLGIPETDLTPHRILEIKQHIIQKQKVEQPKQWPMDIKPGETVKHPDTIRGQDPWRGVRDIA